MAKQGLNLDDWKKEVDRLFTERTGCTWADLCDDEEPVKAAYAAGKTPRQFVTEYIDKNGLWDINLK
jgi:hypothetical protein